MPRAVANPVLRNAVPVSFHYAVRSDGWLVCILSGEQVRRATADEFAEAVRRGLW